MSDITWTLRTFQLAELTDYAKNPRSLSKDQFVCLTCGELFTSDKTRKDRTPKYCSRECYSKRSVSAETRSKQSAAKKGKTPWNKGVAMWSDKPHPRGTLGMKFNKAPATEETRNKLSISHIGLKYPEHLGEKHWNWQGGITNENEAVRKSADYKSWRKAVFERDNYTCQMCGKLGGQLHADHIIPFSVDKTKRLELSNGRTLCVECHKNTETYGVKFTRHHEALSE